VKGIKSLYNGTNENIVILAPTGKCVLKITNDLNDEDFDQVYTIHKFVNFLKRINTESYKKSKVKNLSHIEHMDMLVIDEMSMVTNKLFYEMFSELVESCDRLPRIVFIGYVDQLPAIGTGNVLSNLISRKMVNKNYKGDEENKIIIGDYVMMKTK
jgi:exodeoxyribonuclease V alpha subunit